MSLYRKEKREAGVIDPPVMCHICPSALHCPLRHVPCGQERWDDGGKKNAAWATSKVSFRFQLIAEEHRLHSTRDGECGSTCVTVQMPVGEHTHADPSIFSFGTTSLAEVGAALPGNGGRRKANRLARKSSPRMALVAELRAIVTPAASLPMRSLCCGCVLHELYHNQSFEWWAGTSVSLLYISKAAIL